jgi:hypothetical protein
MISVEVNGRFCFGMEATRRRNENSHATSLFTLYYGGTGRTDEAFKRILGANTKICGIAGVRRIQKTDMSLYNKMKPQNERKKRQEATASLTLSHEAREFFCHGQREP